MANHDGWMLYGASGYTGVLLAEEAARRGLRPLLAGRSEAKLRPLAERLGMPYLAVGLEDPAALRGAMEGVRAVLHCAGPFVDTSTPMVNACLERKVHYLDITGERSVFQQIFSRDAEAKARGVCLIPGVGFDVVPSDCLARYVADQVPGVRSVEIALAMLGRPSPGTVKSLFGFFPQGVWVRRGGELRRVPFGQGLRKIRLPEREAWAAPMALADLETAHRTTGAQDVTVLIVIRSRMARVLRMAWPGIALGLAAARPVLASSFVQNAARRWVDANVRGPDESRRQRTRTFVWARARSGGGEKEAWLECPDGYDYTVHSALNAVRAVLDRAPEGATTPALAFGADFALTVPGTRRLDTLPALP